ncbi:adenosylcobinamide-phosphate synthase CbiB [Luteibacter sp. UNCMF366Tsu5.1]|uniref:adenosylcobinamide-phosphate synthase CbiB n=1 Tax=Luteibacter sp. UNCMF366Tsu5.1 TaxID=1502758 RepID=UPI0009091196|nr:adenosylcobinamide-phosphate synthase CbiB [Luteibacter sp. UNCMF366Tsu5.1]SFW75293.1 adenosylcobinamide-phosphate synthase [Luteibacter sp. UNCMF366Tsu5.1]
MTLALTLFAAYLLDTLFGEPRRCHPLVGFGRWASAVEKWLHADSRWAGIAAWAVAVLPAVVLLWSVRRVVPFPVTCAIDVLVLYLALGRRSLGEHARSVADALDDGDLTTARLAVGRMVSRDTEVLDASQVAAAATESVLENGHDAVFGALFWFVLLGAPGALLFRLANTLDAMWGYRTPRYGRFGSAAARIDDVLGFVPARLTAFTYASLGHFVTAWRCWRTQAPIWDSPNAGPVMAAGAGALRTQLGGAAPYHGQWEERPILGEGDAPDAQTIRRALRLVDRGTIAWLVVASLGGVAAHA